MNQAVTGSDDEAPKYLRISSSDLSRDMGRGFTEQLQISQAGVIKQPIGNKTILIQSDRVGDDFLNETDHVVNIKASLARRRMIAVRY
jgi:hypothetical protein